MGNREIEDSLERLDKLTQEEARMASAEQLKITHGVDVTMRSVEGKVQAVRGDVQEVGNIVEGRVQDVRGDVLDVANKVQDVGSNVRGIDDKIDQANRSLSLQS